MDEKRTERGGEGRRMKKEERDVYINEMFVIQIASLFHVYPQHFRR